jgi:hypothetical protein
VIRSRSDGVVTGDVIVMAFGMLVSKKIFSGDEQIVVLGSPPKLEQSLLFFPLFPIMMHQKQCQCSCRKADGSHEQTKTCIANNTNLNRNLVTYYLK